MTKIFYGDFTREIRIFAERGGTFFELKRLIQYFDDSAKELIIRAVKDYILSPRTQKNGKGVPTQ